MLFLQCIYQCWSHFEVYFCLLFHETYRRSSISIYTRIICSLFSITYPCITCIFYYYRPNEKKSIYLLISGIFSIFPHFLLFLALVSTFSHFILQFSAAMRTSSFCVFLGLHHLFFPISFALNICKYL